MASEAVQARLERIGQGVLAPSQGLAALRAVLQLQAAGSADAVPQVAVNPFNWASYLPQLTQTNSYFFEAFEAAAAAPVQLPIPAAAGGGRGNAPASVADVLKQVLHVLESIVGKYPCKLYLENSSMPFAVTSKPALRVLVL